MSQPFKLFVIHHSHLDIGYTDRQEKIELFHFDFIKQTVDILKEKYKHVKSAQNFKWTCESFWSVENFLRRANEADREIFIRAIKQGDICLSANYTNFTELVDTEILSKKIAACVALGKQYGVQVDSLMTADINGYSWGFAEALAKNGIKNLFSCIHTHHGMFPLQKKQIPFWWQTPSGGKILVWNGEYYHIGNELGIARGYETTYKIIDQFSGKPNLSERVSRAQTRIFNYVAQLQSEAYPYNFAPVMVSGMITDNAPPNLDICNFIEDWNKQHGSKIEIELINLDTFFSRIQSELGTIPCYAGDWTDWWADGVGSTPAAVKLYKDAQRKYHLTQLLDKDFIKSDSQLIKDTENNLLLYAEHTWGYSSSISEPCNTLVNELDLRKTSYAVNAHAAISRNFDQLLYQRGDALLFPNTNFTYKILNPYDYVVDELARINIFYCENFPEHFVVQNLNTNEIYPHQIELISRGKEIIFPVSLAAKEELIVQLKEVVPVYPMRSVINHAFVGSEGVRDIIVPDNESNITNKFMIDNKFVRIKYSTEKGIYSWFDKQLQRDLVASDEVHCPFTPVYQVTAIKTDLYNERRSMGRNRKGLHAQTVVGKLESINILSVGTLFSKVELVYSLLGTSYSSILMTVYHTLPRVDVCYRVVKDNTLNPENLYIPLSFTLRNESTLWIEKGGTVLRPSIDQLPGTCLEYYLAQNGFCYIGENYSLTVALKDAPLLFMGGLDYHQIPLCTNRVEDNQRRVYSWLMNNFWETNFKATLGGAYEFTYSMLSSKKIDPRSLMLDAFRASTGLISFQVRI